MSERLILIGPAQAQAILNDAALVHDPALAQLRRQVQAQTTEISAGCSGCRKRRLVAGVCAGVSRWVVGAGAAELARAKTVCGCDAFLVNSVDIKTGGRSVKRV